MPGTIRQQLCEALAGRPKTAFELSQALRRPEKDIVEHLVHLRRSLPRQGLRLHVVPARCRACDKTFGDRDRLTKPSRCPTCKSERIEPPANVPVAPAYPQGGLGLLAGKTVLVTAGAGTGIGYATAKRCIEEGARVAISDTISVDVS